MCVSLGVGLLLQLHMDKQKPVCPTLGRRMGNLVMYFYMLQSKSDLISLVKFEQFQKQIFVQFILVLVVLEETLSHFVKEFSRISFK